jgi:hypothetical protein
VRVQDSRGGKEPVVGNEVAAKIRNHVIDADATANKIARLRRAMNAEDP